MALQPAMDIFRHNIQGLLDSRGWTVAELARRADTNKTSLGRVLKGSEGLTIDRAEKIAAVFGLPVSTLLANELPPPQQVA